MHSTPFPLPVYLDLRGPLVNTAHKPWGQLACKISLVSGLPQRKGGLNSKRPLCKSSATLIVKRALVLGEAQAFRNYKGVLLLEIFFYLGHFISSRWVSVWKTAITKEVITVVIYPWSPSKFMNTVIASLIRSCCFFSIWAHRETVFLNCLNYAWQNYLAFSYFVKPQCVPLEFYFIPTQSNTSFWMVKKMINVQGLCVLMTI